MGDSTSPEISLEDSSSRSWSQSKIGTNTLKLFESPHKELRFEGLGNRKHLETMRRFQAASTRLEPIPASINSPSGKDKFARDSLLSLLTYRISDRSRNYIEELIFDDVAGKTVELRLKSKTEDEQLKIHFLTYFRYDGSNPRTVNTDILNAYYTLHSQTPNCKTIFVYSVINKDGILDIYVCDKDKSEAIQNAQLISYLLLGEYEEIDSEDEYKI